MGVDVVGRAIRAPLFVPAHRPERFERSVRSGADTVILDLEDAVPVDAKSAARSALRCDLTDPARDRAHQWRRSRGACGRSCRSGGAARPRPAMRYQATLGHPVRTSDSHHRTRRSLGLRTLCSLIASIPHFSTPHYVSRCFRGASISTVARTILVLAKFLEIREKMAHPARFELTTSAFGGQRSIRLSYGCGRPASRAGCEPV